MADDDDDDDDDDLAFSGVAAAGQNDSFEFLFRAFLETCASGLVIWLILRQIHPGAEEYTTATIALAALPVLLWLLYSGRISGFKAFGVELKGAIEKATSAKVGVVADDSVPKPVEYDPSDPYGKDTVAKIATYIENGVETLSFELGRQGYYQATRSPIISTQ